MANKVNSTQRTFTETITATHWLNGGDTKINMMAHAFKEFIVWWALHGFATCKGNQP